MIGAACVVAMDADQAGLVLDSIKGFVTRSPMLADLEITNRVVKNPATASQIRVLSADADSAFGIRPRRVVFDELSLQRDDKLFRAMFSALGKSPLSQMIALSMAGMDFASVGWKVREIARTTDAYWLQTRQNTELAPWLSMDDYEEQRRMLHPSDFETFWNCRWTEPAGAWITREMYEDAEIGKEALEGNPEHLHVAFVDIGLVHNATTVAVMHREAERTVLDTLITMRGTKTHPVELEAVEDTIADLAERFRLRFVRFEAPQAVASVQRLQKRLRACRVEARWPTAETQANLFGTLYRLFANRQIVPFPHEELKKETLHLVTRVQAGRLNVIDSGQIHQDHTIALGGAAELLQRHVVQDWARLTN